MYGRESWTLGKAEHWKIDAFEMCWRRLLKVPWTARRSNQSVLKEISPDYSLEGLMRKRKLQYFGHLMRRTNWLAKTLMLGKTEGRRRRGWQRIRWLDGITDSMDVSFVQTLGDSERQGSLACFSTRCHEELDMTEGLNSNNRVTEKKWRCSTQKKQHRQRQQSSNITLLAYGAIHKVQHS